MWQLFKVHLLDFTYSTFHAFTIHRRKKLSGENKILSPCNNSWLYLAVKVSFSSCTKLLISAQFIHILCNSTSFVRLPQKAACIYEHAGASSAFRSFYKPLMHMQYFQRGLTYIQTQESDSENKSEWGRREGAASLLQLQSSPEFQAGRP